MNPAPKARIRGSFLPGHEARRGGPAAGHLIDLPYPAIEELPEFAGRIDSAALQHGIRHYNGSICRHGARVFMAYRVESFRALSSVGVCELNSEFSVIHDRLLAPETEKEETNIEDPHMASVGGKLYVMVAHVVFGFPPICRQRLLQVDPDTLEVCGEILTAIGNVNGVEKNWTPFELPDGELGIVYKQNPRTVIRVSDRRGWTTSAVPVAPKQAPEREPSSLSGRTAALRVTPELYLEFVGGHVKLPINDRTPRRGTRYWFGAVVFEAKEPFNVVGWTDEPLAWASEASPTIYNPKSGGGHPVCLLPAGAVLEENGGRHVVVSCGVNDSYIALLRFDLNALLERLMA